MAKIVINLESGIFYESCKEASEIYGYNHSTLKSKLNGINKNNTSLIYA
jgi:5-methylcytosine-specific restriction endonuclease McrBC GTP-binding regulatory subunit McrB